MDSTDDDLILTTARHEIGHAMMRWLLGIRTPYITAGAGSGFCAGTGQRIKREDAILISMAGMAAEVGALAYLMKLTEIDFEKSSVQDFEESRKVIGGGRRQVPLSELEPWFRQACEMLAEHEEQIDYLAEHLARDGEMTGRRFSAFMREYSKRLNRETATKGE